MFCIYIYIYIYLWVYYNISRSSLTAVSLYGFGFILAIYVFFVINFFFLFNYRWYDGGLSIGHGHYGPATVSKISPLCVGIPMRTMTYMRIIAIWLACVYLCAVMAKEIIIQY